MFPNLSFSPWMISIFPSKLFKFMFTVTYPKTTTEYFVASLWVVILNNNLQ